MTEQQAKLALEMRLDGYSNLSIARCLSGVSYLEIEAQFGPMPHAGDRMSPAVRDWWHQQPWVWRPDNKQPMEASWERIGNG